MKRKRSPILFSLLLAALHLTNIEAKAYATTDSVISDVDTVASGFYPSRFPIESILNNPAVLKKQLSRNLIQAIGRTQTGEEHFIIHFRKEQLHSEWQSFYTTNQRCDSGRFDKGLPDGEWKTWYPNGQLKTVRHYNAEKFHLIKADIQRNHPKDRRFAITRYPGKNHAQHFRPQYESSATISHSLSILQKIQYNTSGEGSIYLPPFRSCLHHGLYINYEENGVVKDSGNYVNGLKHGLWKETVDTDFRYAFGFYHLGVRQGQWKYYDSDGRLFYTELYKPNGRKEGMALLSKMIWL